MRDPYMMKLSARVFGLALTLGILWGCPRPGYAQGTLEPFHITFDGPPPVPPGSAITVQQYEEAGMVFAPLGFGFGRVGTNPRPDSGRPDNGTAYLQAAFTESLSFRSAEGLMFNLVSVDLAELSTAFAQPTTVRFVGFRFDGSTVTADLITDGIIDGTGPVTDFETFYFGPEFSGLSRVEIPTWGWSLDNLVVVPEPTAVVLFFVGGMFLCVVKLWRRR